jgi:hypothetical protein
LRSVDVFEQALAGFDDDGDDPISPAACSRRVHRPRLGQTCNGGDGGGQPVPGGGGAGSATTCRSSIPSKSFGLHVYKGSWLAIAVAAIIAS